MQVTTDADSPGVLISTEVMVPPYMDPAYSDASMMIPETGSMPKVSGRRSATPETGPMPGRAPMSVPTVTPAAAMTRLNGVKAMLNPSGRLAKKSIRSPGRRRERDAQPVGEDEIVERGGPEGNGEHGPPRYPLDHPENHDQEEHGPHRHPERS